MCICVAVLSITTADDVNAIYHMPRIVVPDNNDDDRQDLHTKLTTHVRRVAHKCMIYVTVYRNKLNKKKKS